MAYDLWMEDGLLRIRLHDTLSPADLDGLAKAVIELEGRLPVIPPRVTEMVEVTEIEVGFREFLVFVGYRRGQVLPNAVRSALVVATNVQLGIARMFQTLNDHPQVTVRIFRDVDSALAWALERDDGGLADDSA